MPQVSSLGVSLTVVPELRTSHPPPRDDAAPIEYPTNVVASRTSNALVRAAGLSLVVAVLVADVIYLIRTDVL